MHLLQAVGPAVGRKCRRPRKASNKVNKRRVSGFGTASWRLGRHNVKTLVGWIVCGTASVLWIRGRDDADPCLWGNLVVSLQIQKFCPRDFQYTVHFNSTCANDQLWHKSNAACGGGNKRMAHGYPGTEVSLKAVASSGVPGLAPDLARSGLGFLGFKQLQ
ncbi:predicted protein [Histoplasma capsulatum G186AR]|uniref:Uncharacterized protein n=1 Tax=Ajellomyces capsulatus (strain G186AR / H82 / ATCC MYA-2454 / RMSCC 2432) TaxID=447093 RepID=C0NDE5_AJECG|nr:uncharacterized protein HCBG_01141 [Histoplasma capsulatum G186AR]EEH11686.1 predicted protein [Histoplasma capsulatum G186AR]